MKRFYQLLFTGMLAATTFAQPSAQPPVLVPSRSFPVPESKPAPVRFDIDFKGGGPNDLLGAIFESSGVRPNVVVHPECRDTRIPAFKLHDVTAGQVFTALNMIADPEPDGYWRSVTQDGGEIWTLVKPPAKQNPGYVTPAGSFQQHLNDLVRNRKVDRTVKVFNLSQVLGDYTIDDVTTAIQGAWDLVNSESKPQLKFHKDTKLLIVMGDAEQLNVVMDLIRELTNNVYQKAALTPVDPTTGLPIRANSAKEKPASDSK